MNIILLGAPGAGKGTQASILTKELGIPAISTGDVIRQAVKNGTDMGKTVKQYVDSGKLVPDEVVIGIVKDRISEADCANGFILDGFPRTIAQAEALDEMGVKIDKVVDIEVGDELIYSRMSGRRICEKCGATFNVNTDRKPKSEGVCDACDGRLIQRDDDALETVKERLKVYYEQTEPLKGYYENQGKLAVIDGEKPLKEATADIIKAVEVVK